jgi:hypothetical protein
MNISSTLNMEMICCSEKVETQRTTRRHIPEDDTLHKHRYENLKSYETSSVRFRYSSLEELYSSMSKNIPFAYMERK